MTKLKAVALGGGHGLHATLTALKRVTDDVTAVVTVADDGLRAGFFELPPDLCATCLYPQPREALAQGRWVRFEVDSRTRRLRRI